MKILKDALDITELERKIKSLEEKVEFHENTIQAMASCLRTQGDALKLLLFQMDIIKLNLNKKRDQFKKEDDVYN